MKNNSTLLVCLLLCVQLAIQTNAQEKPNPVDDEKAETLMLVITGLVLDNKTLRISYEISNYSKQDVWICDSVHERYNFEVYIEEDGETLMVRKLSSVPSGSKWRTQPLGKYIRLRPEEKRIESLLLNVPVNPVYVYKPKTNKQLRRVINAKRLTIEIGYYVGTLPNIFVDMLKETEKTDLDKMILFNMWFGGVLGFNNRNEQLRQRDDEVLIPYTQQRLNDEKIVRTVIDDLSLPYKESRRDSAKYNISDLSTCTQVKIQFDPSMLEYFYPYKSQQVLLSKEDMDFLRSEKTVIVEDSERINDFTNELKQAKQSTGGNVSEKSKANVFCYRDGRRLTSFIVYDNSSVETDQKQRIKYHNGIQSLKELTPQIQPFELRMRCAANLKNLWYRLRFYDRAEKTRVQSYSNFKLDGTNKLNNSNKHDDPDVSDMDQIMEELSHQAQLFFEAEKKRMIDLRSKIKLIYPAPRSWCDALEWSFAGSGAKGKWYESTIKSHICPSVGEGRSTYAMNPNCKYESPPDMVLLFETKAGWNQHGGPELFSFDNHDPKGGCVLLNDGTVKFIRTKEELQKLRWK